MEIHLFGDPPKTLPLPVFTTVHIGTAEQNGEKFDLYLGLNRRMVEKLHELSLNINDADLQANTSDFKRFGQGSYREWYAQNRVPFALVHPKSNSLAALVWFGPKELGKKSLKHISLETMLHTEKRPNASTPETDWHTIAFRSYPPFRGAGIMKDFVRTVSDIYVRYFPYARLWTSNSRSNIPSIKLSEKLGYRIDETLSDLKTVTMVR